MVLKLLVYLLVPPILLVEALKHLVTIGRESRRLKRVKALDILFGSIHTTSQPTKLGLNR